MGSKKGISMAELIVDIPVRQIADIINNLDESERETLLLLLSEDGDELLKRVKDFKENKIKYLSRDEVFDV